MESQSLWTKYCRDHIIKKMRSDRYGNLFTNPVLEASDSVIPPPVKESYRLVIKKPMDYKTVKIKLENGSYSHPEEFCQDMKLIYENCIKFNPPVGNSKWAHDAAVSNLKKFTKLWEGCSKIVNDLYGKSSMILQDKNVNLENANKPDTTKDYSSLQFNPIMDNNINLNGGKSKIYTENSVDTGLGLNSNFNSEEPTPRNKWSFRLNLQSIQEYKLRKGFLNQTPELNSFSNYVETKIPTAQEINLDNQINQLQYERYTPDMTNKVDPTSFEPYPESNLNTTEGGTEFEDLEMENTPVVDINTEIPQILSKNEDGIVCVSFLSNNECNRLFPNCNIIGLSPQKPNYNISDVSIRYIYNQLYLSDINTVKFEHKKEPEEKEEEVMEEEEYKLEENHAKIKINVRGTKLENVEMTEKKINYDPTLFEEAETEVEYQETEKDKRTLNKLIKKVINTEKMTKLLSNKNVQNNNDLNRTKNYGKTKYENMSYAKELDQLGTGSIEQLSPNMDIELSSKREEIVDLYIDIESNSILNVSEAESMLQKNLFSRVSVKGEYFKICEKPQMFLLCGNRGYFKLDESDFVYEEADMKHIRIFFFNCSKIKVKVSCKRSTFTELVLENRYNFSLVNNLHNEFKLGNVSNLPFFTLPNSTPICFSKQQDILYRVQMINNSLPVQLHALHIISTQ